MNRLRIIAAVSGIYDAVVGQVLSIEELPPPEPLMYGLRRFLRDNARPRPEGADAAATAAAWAVLVEQFGLAISPLWLKAASGLTSGITSGTSGFIRQ